MGTAIWIFLVEDDDTIKRLPLARYLRLTERDPKERMPEYANMRVRCVEAGVELEQRKPVEILRLLYFNLVFDSEGRIDVLEQDKERRLRANIGIPILIDKRTDNVIEARHIFAKKRLYNGYVWELTQEMESAIVKAIFGLS